jgi:hypothetical protein
VFSGATSDRRELDMETSSIVAGSSSFQLSWQFVRVIFVVIGTTGTATYLALYFYGWPTRSLVLTDRLIDGGRVLSAEKIDLSDKWCDRYGAPPPCAKTRHVHLGELLERSSALALLRFPGYLGATETDLEFLKRNWAVGAVLSLFVGLGSLLLFPKSGDAPDLGVTLTQLALCFVLVSLDLAVGVAIIMGLRLRNGGAMEKVKTDLATIRKSQVAESVYDVMVCYHSADGAAATRFSDYLRDTGLRPWIDIEDANPGLTWESQLESIIASVTAACILIGPNGFGPWHRLETSALLKQFVDRGTTVIPVLLPGSDEGSIPLFLKTLVMIDLRRNWERGLLRLATILTQARRRS